MARTNRSVSSERLTLCCAEKTADTSQRGIAVALNGAVVPRAAWRDTQCCAPATASKSCGRGKVVE